VIVKILIAALSYEDPKSLTIGAISAFNQQVPSFHASAFHQAVSQENCGTLDITLFLIGSHIGQNQKIIIGKNFSCIFMGGLL
jgi:hypothetical protein